MCKKLKPINMILFTEKTSKYLFVHYKCPNCRELCTVANELALESGTEKKNECDSCGNIHIVNWSEENDSN
jgi:uncharacterized Zn finger protein